MKKNIEIVLWVALIAAAGFAAWTYFPRPDMRSLDASKSAGDSITPALGSPSHDVPTLDLMYHIAKTKKVVEV